MEIDEIRAFVAVARTGSVNRAAAELHRSQPAVTRQIQRLEESLAVVLFDRRTKPLTLTPAGEAVLERCRRVLQAVEDLRAATADDLPAGELRVGISRALAEVVLVEPIERLRRALPRTILEVTTNWSRVLVDQVRAGGLDVGVVQLGEGDRLPGGVTGRVIGRERIVIVGTPGMLGRPVRGLSDLADADWVLHPEGCGFRAVLTEALDRTKAPPRVAAEVHGFELQLSLVARGLGLGLVPARVLAASRFRSRLRAPRVPGWDFRLAVWAVRGRPPASAVPAVAAFEDDVARLLGTRRLARAGGRRRPETPASGRRQADCRPAPNVGPPARP